MRIRLYLVLILLSWVFLFYSILQIYPVIVEVTDPIGLVSHLTIWYWAGLVMVVFCSFSVFLDHQVKTDMIFLVVLITLGMFLYGLPVFVEVNARSPIAYHPTSEVQTLIETGHIGPATSYPVSSYRSWPGIHFITAFIVELTGLGYGFVKYWPIFWYIYVTLITYALGKWTKLEANRCFLLSFLVLSSFVFVHFAYSPQGLSFMLYILFFGLVVVRLSSQWLNTLSSNLLLIIVFSALVIMHPFTSALALLAALPLLLYRKEFRIAILFVSIFGVWYMYLAFEALRIGVGQLLGGPFAELLQIGSRSVGAATMPSWRYIPYWSWRSYFYIYALCIVAVIVLVISDKVKKREWKPTLSPILWMSGAFAAALIPYGFESPDRIFMLCLVPAAYAIVLSFSNRKRSRMLAILLMAVVVVLYLPAQYGSEVRQTQVLTSELSGDRFFAVNILRNPNTTYFYSDDNKLILFFNPSLVTVSSGYPFWSFQVPDKPNFHVLDQMTYVIISKQGTDMMIWAFKEDPILNWLLTENGRTSDLTYNNGYYQIYSNTNAASG